MQLAYYVSPNLNRAMASDKQRTTIFSSTALVRHNSSFSSSANSIGMDYLRTVTVRCGIGFKNTISSTIPGGTGDALEKNGEVKSRFGNTIYASSWRVSTNPICGETRSRIDLRDDGYSAETKVFV